MMPRACRRRNLWVTRADARRFSCCRARDRGEQLCRQAAIAEPIDGKLTATISGEQGAILLGPRAQGAHPAAFPADTSADRSKDLPQGAAGVQRGKRLEVALVGLPGDLGTKIQVGDALPHLAPVERAVRIALFGPIQLEVIRTVDGRLDRKDAALLVIDLDGVALALMLEPNCFRTLSIVADHFTVARKRVLTPLATSSLHLAEVLRFRKWHTALRG